MSADQATVGAFLLGALVAGCSALVWLLPKVRRFFRTVNNGLLELTGTPAEHDRAGREVKPAVPSLSAQVGDIRVAIRDQATQNERLTALETVQSEHGQRLTALEAGHQVERALGHVATAKTMDAIEAAARKSHADVVDEPDTEL